MKKLFFFAAIAALGLASCSSDDVTMGREDVLNENIQSFGTRSSSVDVTIGGKKGFITRGCDVNGNMWSYLPEYPTSDEIAGVMAYIASNPGGVDWPGYTFYYIQHVDGAHHMYSYTDWNGAFHGDIDGTKSLEHFEVLENSGNWQHVYNFNRGLCDNSATHNSALMTDGFNGAKTLDEYGSSNVNNWRLFYWEGNYYLGFDFSMKKGDGEVPADGIYDDWVVKIVPGAGETPVTPPGVDPDPDPDPTPDPGVDPDPTPDPVGPEVEVDIHHQDHKDWNEIKTSIHLRDTVNVRVFIPVDKEYQAVPDDFDIRAGVDYTYIEQEVTEVVKVKYTVASKEFEVDVQVNHKADGIEILLAGADCAEALRYARGVYDDGLTFEIHSYLYASLTPETVWDDILKKVEIPETSLSRWPGNGSCVTHTYGQIHSAFYEDQLIPFVKDPE